MAREEIIKMIGAAKSGNYSEFKTLMHNELNGILKTKVDEIQQTIINDIGGKKEDVKPEDNTE